MVTWQPNSYHLCWNGNKMLNLESKCVIHNVFIQEDTNSNSVWTAHSVGYYYWLLNSSLGSDDECTWFYFCIVCNWWTNNVMETLYLNDFKHFSISVVTFFFIQHICRYRYISVISYRLKYCSGRIICLFFYWLLCCNALLDWKTTVCAVILPLHDKMIKELWK